MTCREYRRRRRRRARRRYLIKRIAISSAFLLATGSVFFSVYAVTNQERPALEETEAVGEMPTIAPEAPTEAHSEAQEGKDLGWTAAEEYKAARMAMAEAEGEDTEGKALVILVIYNRQHSGKFPDTVGGVISQENAFTSYHNGRYDRVKPDADCWAALDLIQIQGWDESQGRYTSSGRRRTRKAPGTAGTLNDFSYTGTIHFIQRRRRKQIEDGHEGRADPYKRSR